MWVFSRQTRGFPQSRNRASQYSYYLSREFSFSRKGLSEPCVILSVVPAVGRLTTGLGVIELSLSRLHLWRTTWAARWNLKGWF